MAGLPIILSDGASLIGTPPSSSLCTLTERVLVGCRAIFHAYVLPAFSHKRTVVFPCNLPSLPSPNVYFLMLA